MALNELNRLKDNFPFERIQVKIRSCFNWNLREISFKHLLPRRWQFIVMEFNAIFGDTKKYPRGLKMIVINVKMWKWERIIF